jgi:molecular chaperone GrpE
MRERLEQWWQRVRREREAAPELPQAAADPSEPPSEPAPQPLDSAGQQLEGVSKSFARLAREQAKANLLWEQSLEQQRQNLEQLQGQLEERQALLQQLQAEAEKRGRQELAQQLLPGYLTVLDGLFQAASAMSTEATKNPLLLTWAEGLRRLHARGEQLLGAWDVTPLAALGEPFDPGRHRPVEVVESADVEQPTVVAEVERGYRQGEQLLRYAGVVVAKPAKHQGCGPSGRDELDSYLL